MSAFINFLTTIRIFLGGFIFLLITMTDLYWVAFFLFMLAGVTDYLDGYFARKFNAVSILGEILDPIADKILIVFTLFALSISLQSSYIAFIGSVIISREIWVGALRDFNARRAYEAATKVIFIAKIKTTMQLFTISLYLFGLSLNNSFIIVISDILLFLALMITLYTGFIYTLKTFQKET